MTSDNHASRTASARTLMDLAREWQGLTQEGEALLGPTAWYLLRSYGKLMSGPYSGLYISALPVADVRALLESLRHGGRIAVHLMHRHRSGRHESSCLSLANGRLWMHYPDRTEAAE